MNNVKAAIVAAVITAGVVGLLVLALFQVASLLTATPSHAEVGLAVADTSVDDLPPLPTASHTRARGESPMPRSIPRVVDDEEPQPKQVLDRKSERFYDKVDNWIPQRIYASAAERCYRPNLPRHEKVKLGMRVRSIRGHISVTSVEVLDTTVTDPALVECVRSAVASAGWDDEEMPDWEDDDQLLIRLGGMKKHVDDRDED